jgi:hypothetical protein
MFKCNYALQNVIVSVLTLVAKERLLRSLNE